ncbi:MAG TPA: Gfo/Idh/MocA family oxidoreductase [Armatimonadota bacterium]|jgi:predicted dehydrogenase|nr:Gfo/Idh/MocA family oxidoreductase [Armatimonadota bacterium]
MKTVAVIGGETHIGEITQLLGERLEIVGAAVREDQFDWAREHFGGTITASHHELLQQTSPDIVAVANENDLKAQVILDALASGADVIADKPLAITMDEQTAIEAALARDPDRRLLNLLTLRGASEWRGLHDVVRSGKIGEPAHCRVRMAVRLKRAERPPWFLDVRRSGGLFLDLLIHGIDQVEWALGSPIASMSAVTGNLGAPDDEHLRDHAAVFCELASGASAVIEGQRMLPDTKGSDYRMMVAGTEGLVDLAMGQGVTVTTPEAADVAIDDLPPTQPVVADWLDGGDLVPQEASLRANRLSILATIAAQTREPWREAADG